jgi:DNA-binding NtrC family response regulator
LQGKILIAEDDRNLRRVLRAMLVREGYAVAEAADGEAAAAWLSGNRADALVSDIRMPKMDGLALFRHCLERHPSLPVILVTAYGTIGDAVQAIRSGAFDYITKPFDEAELLRVVGNAVRTTVAQDGEAGTGESGDEWFGMVGNSPAWLEVRKVVEKAATSPFPVLITGETGTGK